MNNAPASTWTLLVGSLALFLAVSPASAATVNVSATADSMVSAANPANNYGGAGALQVSASGLAKGEFQSLIKFDMAPAKTSFDATFGAGLWTIQSITLQWTATVPGNPLFNSSAAGNFSATWMLNDSWTEGTGTPMAPGASGITWNTLPSFLSGSDQALGTFAFSGATSGTFTHGLGLASGLLGDASSGLTASLLFAAADWTMSGLFNSRSFTTVASRPVLIVTAVPEPSSCLLAAIAACGVFLLRRRTRPV